MNQNAIFPFGCCCNYDDGSVKCTGGTIVSRVWNIRVHVLLKGAIM